MKYFSSAWIWLVLTCFNCATSNQEGLSTEEMRQSMQEHQNASLKSGQYFIGLADDTSRATATDAAYFNITQQLNFLPPGSTEMLRGLYRVDSSRTDRQGRIHVLATLNREQASVYLRKQAREEGSALTSSIAACKNQVKAGQIAQASVCIEVVRQKASRVRDLIGAAAAAVGDKSTSTTLPEERQLEELAGELASSKSLGQVILVGVLKIVDGKNQGDFNSECNSTITTSGWKIASGPLAEAQINKILADPPADLAPTLKSQGAAYAFAGKVTITYLGKVKKKFVAKAKGLAKLLDTANGKIVAELTPAEVTGQGANRQEALNKATADLLVRLQAELSVKLRNLPR